MEIVLGKSAVRQIRLSTQDAIEEGDTETLREDILEAFTEEQVEEIERRLDNGDFYEFLTEMLDEWSGDDVDELFELANFVGCSRPGYAMDRATLDKIPSDKVTMVEIPALAISSTDCRERKHRGEPVWYLVPDGVVQYIAKHRLYQPNQPVAVADDEVAALKIVDHVTRAQHPRQVEGDAVG